MVVALLPLVRRKDTHLHQLLLPVHFTAVSMWVESLRLLPAVPPERRIAWSVVHLHGGGNSIRLCWLLPRRRPAAASRRRALVSHAHVVPDLDGAQCPHAGRSPCAAIRPWARTAPCGF